MKTKLRIPRSPALLLAAALAALPLHAQTAPVTPYAPKAPESASLREAYQGIFHIGVAIGPRQITNAQSAALILKEYDCTSPENVMKIGEIHPNPGNDDSSYNFAPADQYVDFGVKNHLFVIGHNLCWHSQLPAWFSLPDGMAPAATGRGGQRGGRGGAAPAAQPVAPPTLDALKTGLVLTDAQAAQISPLLDELAKSYADVTDSRGRSTAASNEANTKIAALLNDTQKPRFAALASGTVTKEVLLQRLKDNIFKVAGRYKGKIGGWDVVNEALADNAGQAGNMPNGLRSDSPFNRIVGSPEYILMAFKWAHEADPNAELYYNDYNLDASDYKRANCVELIKYLKANGAPITGVGMQGHYNINSPTTAKIDETIGMFAALGVKVMITELDVRAGGNGALTGAVGGGGGGGAAVLNDEQQQALAKRYGEIFAVFLKHRDAITRVTLWGLSDPESWRSGDSPLLHQAGYVRKAAYDAVINAPKVAGVKN